LGAIPLQGLALNHEGYGTQGAGTCDYAPHVNRVLAFEDNECRELTLRLNLGVGEQLIKDSGERFNGDAEN